MTEIVRADEQAIARASEILQGQGLVAFPTETVYGLGADASSPRATAKIYAAKGRPSFNPLIAHVVDLAAALVEARLPPPAVRLAEIFWPGPLTLVVHAAPEGSVCELARAGLETVALRVPAHPVALALLRAFGGPIAAPSANVSGHVSPVTAQHVADDLSEKVDMILDGGRTLAGLESTIVSFVNDVPRLLRPGAIARADIEAALGRELASLSPGEGVLAPGMTASHYAPNARLRLNAGDLEEGEAGLDFGGVLTKAAGSNLVLDLSAQGDLVEAAANLFAHLRALDARGVSRVAVAPVPLSGLGEAINDRLQRAASPR